MTLTNSAAPDQAPREVAVALFWGCLAGFLTGAHLTCALVIMAMVVVRPRLRIALLAWLGSLALAWWLVPLTFRLGRLLLDETAWGNFVASVTHYPVLALLDWDRYTVTGAMAIGPLAAMAIAWLGYRLATIWSTPPASVPATGLAPDAQPIPEVINAAQIPVEPAPAAAAANTGMSAWARHWERLPVRCAVTGAALCAGVVVAAPMVAKTRLQQVLTALNGAPVFVDEIRLSLGGDATLEGLTLNDPQQPESSLFTVGKVDGQLNMSELLRGRLVWDEVTVSDVHVELEPMELARKSESQESGDDLSEEAPEPMLSLDIEMPEAGSAAESELASRSDVQNSLERWPELQQQVRVWLKLVRHLESIAGFNRELRTRSRGHRLGECSRAVLASERTMRSASVLVAKRVKARDFSDEWKLGAGAQVEMLDLQLTDVAKAQSVQVKATLPAHLCRVELNLALDRSDAEHIVKIAADKMPLAQIIDSEATSGTLFVKRGAVGIEGEGSLSSGKLDLQLSADAGNLEIEFVPGGILAGLPTSVWQDALSRMGRFRADFFLVGSTNELRLEVEPENLADQLRHQLRAAGEHDLVHLIEGYRSGTQIAHRAEPVTAPPVESASPYPSTADETAPGYRDPSANTAAPYAVDYPAEQASGYNPAAASREAWRDGYEADADAQYSEASDNAIPASAANEGSPPHVGPYPETLESQVASGQVPSDEALEDTYEEEAYSNQDAEQYAAAPEQETTPAEYGSPAHVGSRSETAPEATAPETTEQDESAYADESEEAEAEEADASDAALDESWMDEMPGPIDLELGYDIRDREDLPSDIPTESAPPAHARRPMNAGRQPASDASDALSRSTAGVASPRVGSASPAGTRRVPQVPPESETAFPAGTVPANQRPAQNGYNPNAAPGYGRRPAPANSRGTVPLAETGAGNYPSGRPLAESPADTGPAAGPAGSAGADYSGRSQLTVAPEAEERGWFGGRRTASASQPAAKKRTGLLNRLWK